jgi:hypothetical protein
MVVLSAGFARVFPEKRLELKSLKRQTKAEEEGPMGLGFLRKNSGKTAEPRVHRGGTDPLLKYINLLALLRQGVSNIGG